MYCQGIDSRGASAAPQAQRQVSRVLVCKEKPGPATRQHAGKIAPWETVTIEAGGFDRVDCREVVPASLTDRYRFHRMA